MRNDFILAVCFIAIIGFSVSISTEQYSRISYIGLLVFAIGFLVIISWFIYNLFIKRK